MYITDYLDKVVYHKASLGGNHKDVLAEGIRHVDPITTMTDVAIKSTKIMHMSPTMMRIDFCFQW